MKIKKTKNKIYGIWDSQGREVVYLNFRPIKKEYINLIREDNGILYSDLSDKELLDLYSIDKIDIYTKND